MEKDTEVQIYACANFNSVDKTGNKEMCKFPILQFNFLVGLITYKTIHSCGSVPSFLTHLCLILHLLLQCLKNAFNDKINKAICQDS